MFHGTLLDMPDTVPVPLRQQGCSLAIWLNHLFTQVMSPSPASTSAVSTRRSITPRGETASTSRMTFFHHSPSLRELRPFYKQAAASGSPQLVPASEVNQWVSADMWFRTWKLVRGNSSNASVEGTLSRGKRDRDWDVQTLSQRRNLHVYLEQKAELAVSEAEADMDIWNWEQRNYGIAVFETNRELESQRLELYQANQWADQAQGEKMNVGVKLKMRNRLFQEVAQEIANKLRNYEESVAKKQIETDMRELMNCPCNRRGILLL